MSKIKFKNQLWLGNGTVLLLLVVIAVVVYKSVNSLVSTSEWVTFTHNMIRQGSVLQKTLRDMRTNLRAFTINGDEKSLSAFYEEQKQFEQTLDQIKTMINKNAELVELLETTKSTAQRWHNEIAEPAIVLYKKVNEKSNDADYFAEELQKGLDPRNYEVIMLILKELREKAVLKSDATAEVLVLSSTTHFLTQQVAIRNFLLTGKEDFLKHSQRNQEQLEENLTSLEQCSAIDQESLKLIHELRNKITQWTENSTDPLIAMKKKLNENMSSLKDVTIFVEIGVGRELMDKILKQLDMFDKAEETLLSQREKDVQQVASLAIYVTTIGTLLAFIFGTTVVFFLTHSTMQMVNRIVKASFAVNVAANEISQGNVNLSQRTEQQASSLEETAASIEQMTSTVQQNTNNTQQAAQLAAQARHQAQQGGTVVESAVSAMVKINESSKQMSEIVSVIDEIAFQTNLLALNAAVEAARAGEQGRGFAVVATEVRSLAQRSAAAAKEIKALIQDSLDKVKEGTQSVNQSGTVLMDIVGAVKKVNDIIVEIAAASQEQLVGIQQINNAITQLDKITQQNNALVEEATTASESLRNQAKNLGDYVSFLGSAESDLSTSHSQQISRKRHSPAKESFIEEHSQKSPPSHSSDSGWQDF